MRKDLNDLSAMKILIGRSLDIDWSIEVRDISSNSVIFSLNPAAVLKTASLAKIFLLVETAARLSEGTLAADEPIDRRDVPMVQGSGLWRHLKTDILPLADASTLVATVSDNWATNALLHRVGLEAVQARSSALGYPDSSLADYVRDQRGSEHPPTVSQGCASDWADLFAKLHRRELVSDGVDRQVEHWLGNSTDHSMVVSAQWQHALSPGTEPENIRVYNKAGWDSGVRADAGLVVGRNACSYCAIANWNPTDDRVDAVAEIMQVVGKLVRATVSGLHPAS